MNSENSFEKDILVGANAFERFYLRPKTMADSAHVLRMKINKGWGGWRLKDELIESIGLEIGDTITTEVSVLNGPGLIEKADDTDLFASGKGADWLLDNNVGKGAVIDAKVRFVYKRAPVGGINGREVWKISLVFLEGYQVVKERPPIAASQIDEEFHPIDSLINALRT